MKFFHIFAVYWPKYARLSRIQFGEQLRGEEDAHLSARSANYLYGRLMRHVSRIWSIDSARDTEDNMLHNDTVTNSKNEKMKLKKKKVFSLQKTVNLKTRKVTNVQPRAGTGLLLRQGGQREGTRETTMAEIRSV